MIDFILDVNTGLELQVQCLLGSLQLCSILLVLSVEIKIKKQMKRKT